MQRFAKSNVVAMPRSRSIPHEFLATSFRLAGLSLLGRETAGSHSRSDQQLVTTHCRFYQGALAVIGRSLPGQAALVCNHRQMAITLCRRTRFAARHSRRARWDHDLDAISIRCYPLNWVVNLIEQRPDLGRIIRVLIGQRLRHDRAAGGVNRQMQLAPRLARFRTMPLASSHWPAP
jgi:hypothetical protein